MTNELPVPFRECIKGTVRSCSEKSSPELWPAVLSRTDRDEFFIVAFLYLVGNERAHWRRDRYFLYCRDAENWGRYETRKKSKLWRFFQGVVFIRILTAVLEKQLC